MAYKIVKQNQVNKKQNTVFQSFNYSNDWWLILDANLVFHSKQPFYMENLI